MPSTRIRPKLVFLTRRVVVAAARAGLGRPVGRGARCGRGLVGGRVAGVAVVPARHPQMSARPVATRGLSRSSCPFSLPHFRSRCVRSPLRGPPGGGRVRGLWGFGAWQHGGESHARSSPLALALPAGAGAHAVSAPAAATALGPTSCPGAAIQPTQVITGEFPSELQGSFVLLPFQVPAGTTAVRVKYCWDPPIGPSSATRSTSGSTRRATSPARSTARASSAAGEARATRT